MNRAACVKASWRMAMFIMVTSLFSSCVFLKKTAPTVPTMTLLAPAPTANKRMVIVLPGRADDLKGLQRSGIAAVIQQHLPDADVVLVELTMQYYLEGRGVQRLQEQIVSPAQNQGYRQIYLAGASLGGMGALMYEREYPNTLSGLILMAPYMGESALIKEIEAAGGLSQWQAGPTPAMLDGDTVPREEWRVVQSLSTNPIRARQVWLVCGQEDQFHGAARLIAQVLPSGNYIEQNGGHTWTVWTAGASKVFGQIGRPISADAR